VEALVLSFITAPEVCIKTSCKSEPRLTCRRELLYLDLALEALVRGAAERGAGASGFGAAALIAPLLQNLCLSVGDNEEPVYCLASWQGLPEGVLFGNYPSKEDALKVMNPAVKLL
jgi:alpha-glucan,water dikinase